MPDFAFERRGDVSYGAYRSRASNINPDAESSESEPQAVPSKTPGVVDPMIVGKGDVRAEAYARVQSRDDRFSDPNPNARAGRASSRAGGPIGPGFLPPAPRFRFGSDSTRNLDATGLAVG